MLSYIGLWSNFFQSSSLTEIFFEFVKFSTYAEYFT
jgi:hypothetical protein